MRTAGIGVRRSSDCRTCGIRHSGPTSQIGTTGSPAPRKTRWTDSRRRRPMVGLVHSLSTGTHAGRAVGGQDVTHVSVLLASAPGGPPGGWDRAVWSLATYAVRAATNAILFRLVLPGRRVRDLDARAGAAPWALTTSHLTRCRRYPPRQSRLNRNLRSDEGRIAAGVARPASLPPASCSWSCWSLACISSSTPALPLLVRTARSGPTSPRSRPVPSTPPVPPVRDPGRWSSSGSSGRSSRATRAG